MYLEKLDITIKRYYATNSQRITGNLSTSFNEDPNIFINLCISNVCLLNILVSRNETPSLCEPFSSLTHCKASLVQVTTKYKDYFFKLYTHSQSCGSEIIFSRSGFGINFGSGLLMKNILDFTLFVIKAQRILNIFNGLFVRCKQNLTWIRV